MPLPHLPLAPALNILRNLWFTAALILIAGVSLYDTALIVKYSESIWYMEENPMGRWLLRIAERDVEVFVRVKLAGTVVVCSVLAFLWRRWQRIAVPVTGSIASCQASLLAYLTLV